MVPWRGIIPCNRPWMQARSPSHAYSTASADVPLVRYLAERRRDDHDPNATNMYSHTSVGITWSAPYNGVDIDLIATPAGMLVPRGIWRDALRRAWGHVSQYLGTAYLP